MGFDISYRECNYVEINWTGGIDTTIGVENYLTEHINPTDSGVRSLSNFKKTNV
jgi:hypothetical protein